MVLAKHNKVTRMSLKPLLLSEDSAAKDLILCFLWLLFLSLLCHRGRKARDHEDRL